MARTRTLAALASAVLLAATLTACSGGQEAGTAGDPSAAAPAASSGTSAGTASVVHVPADASLAEAGEKVAAGGVILIAPGTYTESLAIKADDVTVRGEDRNTVILDGELTRSNGIVATGQRPAIENLTVRNFLQNGVLVTGVTDENGAGVARGPEGYLPDNIPDPVPGYLVQRVTAQNNGLYGIYAFNRTGGTIRDNLATGGSDSGVYVGQCADCDASVSGNVLTLNAVGIELANASHVSITGNRIVKNRIGLTVLSNYLEAHGPTKNVQIAGNVIADNNEPATPEQANGAFGTGVGLSGTVDAVVTRNLIAGHQNAGVWVDSSDDFAPTGNKITDNAWSGNRLAAVLSPSELAVGQGNCFDFSAPAQGKGRAVKGGAVKTLPAALAKGSCPADGLRADYRQPEAPAGLSFAKVATTPERPGLKTVDESPRTVPDRVKLPEVKTLPVPSADLLKDAK